MDSLDFNNHIVARFGDFIFTETMRNQLVVSASLIVLAICVRMAMKNFTDRPKGFQNFVEFGIEMFQGLVNDTVGPKYAYYGNWYFTVFLFVLMSNYVGLVGLRAPTADLATTLALAIVTFVLIHFTGITKQKGGYFKGYLDPIAIFAPVNVLSAFATPISLSFRLFGNILGGTIIMGMLYAALPKILNFIIPVPFHLYFDIFAGAIQAVIFTMLGLLFINEQIPEE